MRAGHAASVHTLELGMRACCAAVMRQRCRQHGLFPHAGPAAGRQGMRMDPGPRRGCKIESEVTHERETETVHSLDEPTAQPRLPGACRAPKDEGEVSHMREVETPSLADTTSPQWNQVCRFGAAPQAAPALARLRMC